MPGGAVGSGKGGHEGPPPASGHYPPPPMCARIWVVIPTYNEAVNVEGIVRAAATELDRVAGEDYRILIVDDNSPDGTGAIADSLAAELDHVEVMHRPGKAGLGHAYMAGFARALEGGPSAWWRWTPISRTTPATWSRSWPRPTTPTWSSAPATSVAAACATGGCCGG